MKVKVKSKGSILVLPPDLKVRYGEVEVEVPEEYVLQKKGGEKHSFCEVIRETFGDFPEEPLDWKKAWHKHLEEKYRGSNSY